MTATTAPPSPSPWSGRDFRLVWAGGLVNDTGDWLLRVALPVYVFTETSSGTLTAALFLIELAVSVVLGPIAGSLIDRWDLRRTLVVTNLLQAVTLLPLLAVTPDRIWPAFLVAAVQSVLTRINNPAKVALLPRLVGPDQLIAANAANAASESLSRLVGSPLGGVVVELFGLGGVVRRRRDQLRRRRRRHLVRSHRHVAGQPQRRRADAAGGTRRDPPPTAPSASVFGMIRRTPALRTLVSASTITSVAQGMFVVLYLAFVVRSLGWRRGRDRADPRRAGDRRCARQHRHRPPRDPGVGTDVVRGRPARHGRRELRDVELAPAVDRDDCSTSCCSSSSGSPPSRCRSVR